MFGAFPTSIGVANVKPYLAKMQTPPKFITTLPAGQGFSEIAEFLKKTNS
jgi:hypothetical protein